MLNNIEIINDKCFMYIKDKEIIFDIEDLEEVDKYKWGIWKSGIRTKIRVSKNKYKTISLNYVILKLLDNNDKTLYVKYKDGNKFNNQKNNLNITYRKNEFIIKDEVVYVITSQKKQFLIDKSDLKLVKQYIWYIDPYDYVITNIKGKKIRLHNFLMNPEENKMVDHRNHNPLDNRRNNLRICTEQQNNFNLSKMKNKTSQYKGVCYKDKSWVLSIQYNKTRIEKRFSNEIACANAYNYYAKTFFDEFAVLNEVPYMNYDEWSKFIKKKSKTSNHKGISYKKNVNRWYATYKEKHLGCFGTEQEAIKCYDNYIKSIEGD